MPRLASRSTLCASLVPRCIAQRAQSGQAQSQPTAVVLVGRCLAEFRRSQRIGSRFEYGRSGLSLGGVVFLSMPLDEGRIKICGRPSLFYRGGTPSCIPERQ